MDVLPRVAVWCVGGRVGIWHEIFILILHQDLWSTCNTWITSCDVSPHFPSRERGKVPHLYPDSVSPTRPSPRWPQAGRSWSAAACLNFFSAFPGPGWSLICPPPPPRIKTKSLQSVIMPRKKAPKSLRTLRKQNLFRVIKNFYLIQF